MSAKPPVIFTTSDLTKEQRGELRDALMGDRANHALRFQTKAVRAFGPAAGIFIRQLMFWQGREEDPEGWIYKSRREMQEETGLNQKQQEKARKALRGKEVLEEEIRPVGRLKRKTLHYKINLVKLMEIVASDEAPPTGEGFEDPEKNQIPIRNPLESPVPETLQGIRNVDPYSDSAIQKRTSEEEQQNSSSYRGHGSAVAPPGEETANKYVARLVKQLEAANISLDRRTREKYGQQFKKQLEEGATASELEQTADQMARRRTDLKNPYQFMSVEEALEDVRAG